MSVVAVFDIGTTDTKGVLIGRDGAVRASQTVPLLTSRGGQGQVEQDPGEWWASVVTITRRWWDGGADPREVAAITFTGQMQDCIPVGAAGRAARPAILYSDGRAGPQASQILETLGEGAVRAATGNPFDGSAPLAKLLWLHEHEPGSLGAAARVLISAKDYAVHRLTGRWSTDPTSAATSGMLDLGGLVWRADWLVALGLDPALLPEILPAGAVVGLVTASAAAETGLRAGTPVLCGVGDAGATTVGAGVSGPGQAYAYLGTTGWVAAPAGRDDSRGPGVYQLPTLAPGGLFAVAPVLNAGNAHRWALSVFGEPGPGDESDAFDKLERAMAGVTGGPGELLCLPYLNGERCPVPDPLVRGCFVGLSSATTRAEMALAVLEGVAMSIRQVAGLLSPGRPPDRLTLIGGSTRSRLWCQVIADVCNAELRVPGNAPFLPALGAAAGAFVHLGWAASVPAFTESVVRGQAGEHFSPDPGRVRRFEAAYRKFVSLYPALRHVFGPSPTG